MAGDVARAVMAHRQALTATVKVEHAIRNDYPKAVIDTRVDELAEAFTRYGRYALH